ncbi:MAG: DUF4214 domain-containing protein [Acidimicrobiales bacterium]
MATIPVVFASAGSATDLGGLNAVTNGNALSTVPSMSNDGNLIAFHTQATNLPGGPTAAGKNVVLYNVSAGTFTTITNTTGTAEFPSISGNGQYVAYHNLGDIIVYNVATGAKTNITGNANSGAVLASVANNGTVVFESDATDLVPGDTVDTVTDIFLSTLGGTKVKVSSGAGMAQAPSISDDGSTVAYIMDTGGVDNLFVYDVAGATNTQRTNGNFDTKEPAVNSNGSVIAFGSDATNLPGAAANGNQNVFTLSGSTIKRLTNGNSSSQLTDISADGAFVVFTSNATNFSAGTDVNGGADLFRVNASTGTIIRLSNDANAFGAYATTNGDGSRAAFATLANNQLPGMNGNGNVVLWGAGLTTPTASTTTSTTAPTTTTTSTPVASDACLTTPPAASQGFGLTSKPSDRNTLYRAYCVTLLRWPDLGGFNYWLGVRQSGVSWEFIEDTISDSPEFKARYGTLTDDQFVARIYNDVLKRQSDAEGLAYWQGLLRSKQLTRGQVLFFFSDSAEFKIQTKTA